MIIRSAGFKLLVWTDFSDAFETNLFRMNLENKFIELNFAKSSFVPLYKYNRKKAIKCSQLPISIAKVLRK
jgi:hypothetical protein